MQTTQFQIKRENETQRLQFISSLPDVDLPYLESITLSPSTVVDFLESFHMYRGNILGHYDVYMSFRVTAILCLLEIRKQLQQNTLEDIVFTHEHGSIVHTLTRVDLYTAAYSDIMESWDSRFSSKRTAEDLALQETCKKLLGELSSVKSISEAFLRGKDKMKCETCKNFVYKLYLRV
jgi:hypothetical protein